MAFSRLNPRGTETGQDDSNDVIDIQQLAESGLSDYESDINTWAENEFAEDIQAIASFLAQDTSKSLDDYFSTDAELQELIDEYNVAIELAADATETVEVATMNALKSLVFELRGEGLQKVLSKLLNVVDKQAAVNGFFHQYINYIKSGHTESAYFLEELGRLVPSGQIDWRVVEGNGNFSRETISYAEAMNRLQSSDVVFKETIFSPNSVNVSGILVADIQDNPIEYPNDCTVPSVATFEETVPLYRYQNKEYHCQDCNSPEDYEEFQQEKQFELENTMVGYNPDVIFCTDDLHDIDDTEFLDDEERDRNQERALNRITNKLAPYLNDVPRARGADKDAIKHLAHTLKRVEDHGGLMQVGTILHLVISKYNTGELQGASKDDWETRGDNAGLDMNGNGLFRKNDAKYLKKLGQQYLAFRENEQGFPVYKSVMYLLTKELTIGGIITDPDLIMSDSGITLDMIDLWNRENDLMNNILDRDGDGKIRFTEKDKKAIRRWSEKGEKRAMKRVAKLFEDGSMTTERMIQLLLPGNRVRRTKEEKEFVSDYQRGGNVSKLADALSTGMSPAEAYRAHLMLNNATLNCTRFEAMGITDPSRQKTYGAIHMMADRNLDGKKTEADGDIVTGLQMENIFIGTITDIEHFGMDALGIAPSTDRETLLKDIEDKVICNITQYVVQIAQSQGLHNLTNKLLMGSTGDSGVVDTGEELYRRFRQNPGLVKLYQNVLLQSPLPLNYIMSNGKEAAEIYHGEVRESMYENMEGLMHTELSAEDEKLIDDNAKKRWNQITAEMSDMGLTANETVYQQFRTNFSAFAMGMVDVANPSLTGGAGTLAISHRLATFFGDTGQLNLTAMVGGLTDGDYQNGLFGIGVAYNQQLWKGAHLDAFGGGAGVGPAGFAFMPIAQIGITQDIDVTNYDKLRNSLKPGSKKTLQFGPHVTMLGPIPAIGGKVGVHHDRLGGIEENYESLRGSMRGMVTNILADRSINWNLRDTDIRQYEAKRLKNIDAIKKHLRGLKGPNNLRQKAAENVYKALQYFGANGDLLSNPAAQSFFTDTVADYYAVEWRNREMLGMNGKWKYSGWQIGVDFLAGFFPIPSAAVYLTKHKELTREDGEIGKQRVEIAEKEGLGNYRITPENEITGVAVDWMNDVVEDIFQSGPNRLVDENGIDQQELDANDMLLEDVNGDGKEDFLIPESLWQNDLLNLKVDPSMEGHMMWHQHENGARYLAVDKQVPVRFLRGYMGRSRVLVMNIGDTDTDHDDIAMRRGNDFPAGFVANDVTLPEQFGTMTSMALTPLSINTSLSGLQNNPVYNDFPLVSAMASDKAGYLKFACKPGTTRASGVDGNVVMFENNALYVKKGHITMQVSKTAAGFGISTAYARHPGESLSLTYAVPDVAEAITQHSIDTTWLSATTTDLPFEKPVVGASDLTFTQKTGQTINWIGATSTSGGVTKIPKQSHLLVKKLSANNYEVRVSPHVAGFSISLETPGASVTSTSRETLHSAGSVGNLFEFDRATPRGQIDAEIDKPAVYKALWELENTHPNDFRTFMRSLATIDAGGVLDTAEITKALQSLNSMLTTANVVDLKTMILSATSSSDMEAQSYLCLKMRAVFAMEPGYTQYTLQGLYNQRKETYRSLKGLNGQKLPANIDIRRILGPKLQGKLTQKYKREKHERNNLIGFTSFYRASVGSSYGRRGLTPPGGTNVYAGVTEKIPTTDALREWFSSNLLKNEFESKIFISMLQKKVPAEYHHLLKPEYISSLLTGETITTQGGEVKIQLKGNFVAYLLGECANESVGYEIEDVLIAKKKEEVTPGTGGTENILDVTCEGQDGCSDTVEVDSREQQEGQGGLRVNTPESWSVNNFAGKKDMPLGFALVGRKPPEASTQPGHGETGTSNGEVGNGNQNTNQGGTRPGSTPSTNPGTNGGTRPDNLPPAPTTRTAGSNEFGAFTQTQNELQLNKRRNRGRSRRRR